MKERRQDMKMSEYLTEIMTTIPKELEESLMLEHEQRQNLLAAYNFLIAVPHVALRAMSIYPRGIPERLDTRIRTAVEKSRQAIADYRSGQMDAKALKTAIKECRAETSEIRKTLKATGAERKEG